MKIFKLVPILFSLSFMGCASTEVRDGVSGAIPFIAPASELATGVVLQFVEKDPATRQELANQLYGVAGAVRTLTGGQVPTVDQFHKAIGAFTPKYPHWVDLTTSLSSVYAGFFPKIKGDPALALQVLEAIAEGVESGAARIAPAAQPVP